MALEKENISLDPHKIPTPEGAEGWEEMYPSHFLFGKDREEEEDSQFWIQFRSHEPEVLYPIDFSFGQPGIVNAHAFSMGALTTPTTWGFNYRVLNGYGYIYSNEISDPKIIEERMPIFQEKVRYLMDNWDEVWRNWKERCLRIAKELEEISWPELKTVEDLETSSFTTKTWQEETAPSAMTLLRNWNKLKNLMYEAVFSHMEPSNISLTGYLVYRDSFLKAFPGTEEKIIADTLAGVEQPMMEGDFHLRELAELAVNLGIQEEIKRDSEPGKILEKLKGTEKGRKWLKKWEDSKFWFHLTDGNGQYHFHTSWLDDLRIPFGILRNYISLAEKGEKVTIDRYEKEREARKLFEGYRELLPTEEDKKALTELWEGARQVSTALEGHGFYSDQWLFPLGFKKIFELGELLQRHGILNDFRDMRFLRFFEIEEILNGLQYFWYVKCEQRVKPVQEKIEKRKKIIEALKGWSPPPVLMGKKAKPPERITIPYAVVLFGITKEKVEEMMEAPEKVEEIKGWGASPGVYEGTARVVKDPIAELDRLKEGDILVTNFLYPSQATVFSKVKSLVADSGGIMSHPAIVAREYGIPAIVGAAIGMNTLKDGMKIRVDGTKGIVTILES